MKNSKRIIVLLLVLGVFNSFCAQAQKGKALLWKVSGNGLTEPSYIFGTYHLLGDKFLSEVPEADAPFKNATGIVVETVIDSSMIMRFALMGVMKDNKISNLMSPEDFKLVSAEFEKITGMSLKTLDMFKPAQVTAMMVLMQAQKLNEKTLTKYAGVPLDIYFAYTAKKSGRPVTQLETMEEQIKLLFDHFTVEEQARQLVEYVKQSDQLKKTHVDMLDLYIHKDLPRLLAVMESYPQELGETDFMLKDRNIKWVQALPAIMRTGSQFIAVGAGHLPGKDGLIELLRKEGYTVKPVKK